MISGCENCSVDTLEVLMINDTILFERGGGLGCCDVRENF